MTLVTVTLMRGAGLGNGDGAIAGGNLAVAKRLRSRQEHRRWSRAQTGVAGARLASDWVMLIDGVLVLAFAFIAALQLTAVADGAASDPIWYERQTRESLRLGFRTMLVMGDGLAMAPEGNDGWRWSRE